MMTNKTNWAVVLTMAIGIFLCMLDTTVMNIALPAIQSGLTTNLAQLSWALNIYTVLFATLTIPLGRIADIHGRNRVYLIGMGIFVAGSLVSGLAGNVPILILGRGVQSIGAAIVFPASMTIGIQSVPLAQRTNVIATLGVTQGLAAALGPTIGGLVMQLFGWRGIFLINIPLGLIALGLCWRLLDRSVLPGRQMSLDVVGSILSMIVLFSLTLGLVKGGDWGWQSGPVISLLVVNAVALISFIIVERRAQAPMIPLALFQDRQFVGAAIMTVVSGIFLVAIMVLMPSFFTKVQGKTELMAALMVTPVSVMIFIWSPISGFLLAKVGPRLVISTGVFAMISGYFMLSRFDPTKYWQFLIAAILCGTGYGVVIGPITVLAAGNFKGTLLTASQSVIGVFRQIGTSLAVAIFVAALTANLSTAKQRVWQNAQLTVGRLNVATTVKQATLKRVRHQLITEETTNTVPKHAITTKQTNRIIAQTYQQVVTRQHLTTQPLNVRRQAYRQVQMQVRQTVTHDNQQLAHAIEQIHTDVTRQLTWAFMRPYQQALPWTLMMLLTIGLFKSRRVYQEEQHRERC